MVLDKGESAILVSKEQTRAYALFLLMLLVLGLLVAVNPRQQSATIKNGYAKFIIAGWDFPDDYGQGIDGILVYTDGNLVASLSYNDPLQATINASSTVVLKVWAYLNLTQVGASTFEEGKNYIRHSVTVSLLNGTILFSQQNFTYGDGIDNTPDPINHYRYDVTLDFTAEPSTTYLAVVTYEVYY